MAILGGVIILPTTSPILPKRLSLVLASKMKKNVEC